MGIARRIFRVDENDGRELGGVAWASPRRIVSAHGGYLSNTELKGRFCLRVCIVNHLTRDKDIDAVVPEVLDAASEIMSEYA